MALLCTRAPDVRPAQTAKLSGIPPFYRPFACLQFGKNAGIPT